MLQKHELQGAYVTLSNNLVQHNTITNIVLFIQDTLLEWKDRRPWVD